MTDATNAKRQAHNSNEPWRKTWPVLAAVIRELIGTEQPAKVAAYLGRVDPQTIRDWRNGRRGVPTWVIETVRQRLAELAPGPGYRSDIHRKNPFGGAYSWEVHKRKTPAT